ncbi:Oidioi.mRNA.OKI2018_I69.YSR.g17085.t1.cds [Oikopleura dioica]|uniref:Oidioi.mRNA.OKI2018_I69.YSR.g17085.t1.cds n=1 Tax=Oikopleura dioica TaxID=34765 RepID=A0ABN7SSG3_OIKDI|nr:Oidioi.mRNA.OKI2018_I69.YSR.g17085.t1.cds [Oikopleura dioica]
MEMTAGTVKINKRDYDFIMEERLKDDVFALKYEAIAADKNRRARLLGLAKQAAEETLKWQDIVDAREYCKGRVERGLDLHEGDKEAWAMDAKTVQESLDNALMKANKIRAEQLALDEVISKSVAALKKYVVEERRTDFAYKTDDGAFYKICLGSDDLEQPKAEDARKVGIEWRKAVATREGIASLTFAKAKDILSRYTQAIGHDHHSFPNLNLCLQNLLENKTMSRFDFLLSCRKACTQATMSDLCDCITRMAYNDADNKILHSSMDPDKNRQQRFMQNQLDSQADTQYLRKLKRDHATMTAEEKIEYADDLKRAHALAEKESRDKAKAENKQTRRGGQKNKPRGRGGRGGD